MDAGPPSRLSINLRWLGIAYVCVVLAGAVLGMDDRFFPAAGYSRLVGTWAWAHAAFGGLLTLGAGLLPDLKTGRRPPIVYFLISAPVMAYAGYASVASGAPHIAHLLSQRPQGQVFFRVDDFTLKHGSCKNGLEVSSPAYQSGKVCGLSQAFRDQLKAGDRIILRGPRSVWGIAWEDLSRAK